uniref:Glutamic acid-rich protein-like n=1 Tax=Nicotiana tabacum TaxID=4097 RepID=A0A1S4C2R9_TOBAC|nr:PREDICTED: glutamic acid-rich protein-like [Nicotiana tabacum]
MSRVPSLSGYSKEEVFVKQPPGFENKECLEHMYNLDKLQEVSDSFNPKKKKIAREKTPGKGTGGTKRKTASFILVAISPTKGKTIRSQKKQSEANLNNALAEGAKKASTRAKKKVSEPSEAVQIEEMNLVLQDEDEVEDMEVPTPSAKSREKISQKKSQEKEADEEGSAVSKRTRSARKGKKVQVMEEDNEEETDEEEDKSVTF